MTELTDDRIEELFVDLRAGQLHLVRPPGAAVARATVRRRRVTSVAAAIVVFAAVGASVAVVRPQALPGLTPASGDRQAASPENRALEALPPDGVDPLAAKGAAIRGTGLVDPSSTQYAARSTPHGEPHSVVPGTYGIYLKCVGDGTVRFTVTFMPIKSKVDPQPDNDRFKTVESGTILCDSEPGANVMELVNSADGFLRIDVLPTVELTARAVYAYSITRKQQLSAEVKSNLRSAYEALAAAHPEVQASDWGSQFDPTGIMAFYTPVDHGYASGNADAKPMKAVCVGPGVLTVVISPKGRAPVRVPIPCGTEARVQTFDNAGMVTGAGIALQIDGAGRGRAAYAMLIPRPDDYPRPGS